MLPLSTAWTYEEGFPSKTGILGFRNSAVPVSDRTGEDTVHSSIAQYRPKEPVSVSRSCTGTSRHIGRPERSGYGPRQRTSPQAGTLGVQGCVYAITPPAESVDQPVI